MAEELYYNLDIKSGHENLIITMTVGMWVQSQAGRLCKLRQVLICR